MPRGPPAVQPCGPDAQPTTAAAPDAGTTRLPNWSRCKPNMKHGWKPCPKTLQDTATAEALRTISELDLTELQAIDPPRGFGRD